jgi:hypothetical protein
VTQGQQEIDRSNKETGYTIKTGSLANISKGSLNSIIQNKTAASQALLSNKSYIIKR